MSILDSNLQQISEEKISEMQLQKMIQYCSRHTTPLTYGAALEENPIVSSMRVQVERHFHIMI